MEIIKVNADKKTERIPNVKFEIRRADDGLVDTVTTDKNGRAFLSLEDGHYYAVEIESAEGFELDNTPHYFEVKDGKTTTLTVENILTACAVEKSSPMFRLSAWPTPTMHFAVPEATGMPSRMLRQ